MSKNSSKNLANKGPNLHSKTPLEGYEDLVFLKNIISSKHLVFDVAKESITFIKNNPNPNGLNNMRGKLS